MNIKSFVAIVTFGFSFVFVSAEDILTLNNQMRFKGTVMSIKSCSISFKVGKEKYIIPPEDVYSVTFGDTSSKVYTAYMALADDDPEKCMKGRLDAQMLHGQAGKHIALGVLFGPFAIIGAAVANPIPQRGSRVILSQNLELFQDPMYLICYARKARGKNVTNAALGWTAWLIYALTALSVY
ncbi:MAG: hypothetical protein R3C61_02175 [Bacteroidia bacterium]